MLLIVVKSGIEYSIELLKHMKGEKMRNKIPLCTRVSAVTRDQLEKLKLAGYSYTAAIEQAINNFSRELETWKNAKEKYIENLKNTEEKK